jgi:hypothetical protein
MRMPATPDTSSPPADAAHQPIAACGGDPKEVVKALLVAVDFLEAQVDELRRLSQPAMRAAASTCGATARRS